MKKTLLTISIMAGLMMTACVKESANEQMGLPEGAMMLTTEGFQGHNTKTSVSGTSVQWVGDGTEKVYLNGNEYTVGLTGGNAYVTASDADKTGETYGYTGLEGTPTWTSGTKTLSVTVPAEYTSSYSGGRQVIALPMVAYKDATADKIEFKHVTAAVKVRIKNTVGEAVYLDKVVVKSAGKKLNGDVDVVLNDVDGMSTQTTSTASEKQVTVYFAFNTATINNYSTDADIVEVQVPILPLEASDLTVEVYTHKMVDHSSDNSGLLSVSYSYNFRASKNVAQDIDRNVMLTAGVNIQTNAVSPSTMNEVDHSQFSVSALTKVRFSMGNLRWSYDNGAIHTTSDGTGSGTWSFATNQYDIIGNAAGNTTADASRSTNNSLIDLFGWGTSGWNNGNTNYMPYNSASTSSSYGPKSNAPTTYYSLTGTYANADWGVYNAISNGGNTVGKWRTLSDDEWKYLFEDRDNASNKYGCAIVNSRAGIIVLPDDFTDPMKNNGSSALIPASSSIDFAGNTYTIEDWSVMEASGAVFLPFAGYRNGTSVTNNPYTNTYGVNLCYWSSTYKSSNSAYHLYFNMSSSGTGRGVKTHNSYNNVPNGQAVRLVKDVE